MREAERARGAKRIAVTVWLEDWQVAMVEAYADRWGMAYRGGALRKMLEELFTLCEEGEVPEWSPLRWTKNERGEYRAWERTIARSDVTIPPSQLGQRKQLRTKRKTKLEDFT